MKIGDYSRVRHQRICGLEGILNALILCSDDKEKVAFLKSEAQPVLDEGYQKGHYSEWLEENK